MDVPLRVRKDVAERGCHPANANWDSAIPTGPRGFSPLQNQEQALSKEATKTPGGRARGSGREGWVANHHSKAYL
eukprot:12188929-Prorocentrum_lima.AAC.1